jgi:hypothetical protein
MLNEPTVYMPRLGMPLPGQTVDSAKQHLFTLVWMQHILLGFQAGTISEQGLRSDAVATVFRSEIGREY